VAELLNVGEQVRDVEREENQRRDYQDHKQANQLQRRGMFFPPWHRMSEFGSEADGPSDRSERGGGELEAADESDET
jgi:primosomal protein N'